MPVYEGDKDAFEDMYKAKFKNLLSNHGTFIQYEKDTCVKDIGLNLGTILADGRKLQHPAIIWFQLKGILASTLPEKEALHKEFYEVRLDTERVKFLCLNSDPVYVIIYIESLEKFFYVNIKESVAPDGNIHDILNINTKTFNVKVPKEYALTEVDIINIKIRALASSIERFVPEELPTELSTPKDFTMSCMYFSELIIQMHLSQKYFKVFIRDWQAKTRTEVSFNNDGIEVFRYWEMFLNAVDIEDRFPFLDFSMVDDTNDDFDSDYEDIYEWILKSGEVVYGINQSDECYEFNAVVLLNPLGVMLAEWIELMINGGFISINHKGIPFLSRHITSL